MGNTSSNPKTAPAAKPQEQNPQQIAAAQAKAEQEKIERRTKAFRLAQLYQVDRPEQKKDIGLAFDFYIEAARLGHPEALAPLARLGEEVSATRQLALSSLYGAFFHNPAKHDYWRNKAQEVDEFKFKI